MKQPVNRYLVHAMLDPIGGLGDDDEAVERYWDFDPNDDALREVIRREFVPYSRRWNSRSQAQGKRSLAYMLSFQRDKLEGVFDATLPPFAPDDYPRFSSCSGTSCSVRRTTISALPTSSRSTRTYRHTNRVLPPDGDEDI